MAGISVDLKINEASIRDLNSDQGLIGAGVAKAAGKVRDQAKLIISAEGRVDTGAMRGSIRTARLAHSRGPGGRFSVGVGYQIGTDLPYARFQHQGTLGPIFPRHARVLRFRPSGSTGYVFRPRVRGIEAVPFLTRALESLNTGDFITRLSR